MPSEQQLYSQDDAEAILSLASRHVNQEAINRNQLLQTASELGITPEAIAAAEAAYFANRQQDVRVREENELRVSHRKSAAARLRSTFIAFLTLNLFFAYLCGSTPYHYYDPIWFLFGSLALVGLSVHAYLYYSKFTTEEAFHKWLLMKRADEASRRYPRDRLLAPQGPGQDLMAQICMGGQLSREEAIQRYRSTTGADRPTAKQVLEDHAKHHPGLFD